MKALFLLTARKLERHFPGYRSFAETPQQDAVDGRRLGESSPGNGVLAGGLTS